MVAVLGQRNRVIELGGQRVSVDALLSLSHHELRALFLSFAVEIDRRGVSLPLTIGALTPQERWMCIDGDKFRHIALQPSAQEMLNELDWMLGDYDAATGMTVPYRERTLDFLAACDDLLVASRSSLPQSEAINVRDRYLIPSSDVMARIDTGGDAYGVVDERACSRMLGTLVEAPNATPRVGLPSYQTAASAEVTRAIALVQATPELFRTLPLPLRANRSVAAVALRGDGRLLEAASDALRAEPELVRAALVTSPEAYVYALGAARNNEDLAMMYVSGRGSLSQLPEALRQRDPVLRALIAGTPSAVTQLPSEILHDFARLAELIGPQFQTLAYLPREIASDLRFWRALGSVQQSDVTWPLLSELAALPEAEVTTLATQVRAAGFTRYTAFANLSVLRRVLADSLVQANDARPVALVIMPRDDWNGAFSDRPEQMAELQRTHRVVYREIENEREMVAAFRALGSARAEFVMLGGHGEQHTTQFGTDRGSAAASMDLTDSWLVAEHLERWLTPNARVMLLSCSTGAGREAEPNNANFVARMLPGATIDAPAIPSNYDHIVRDNNGHIVGVCWLHGPNSNYTTRLDQSTPLGRAVRARLNASFGSRAMRSRAVASVQDLLPFFAEAAHTMRSRHLRLALPNGRSIGASEMAQLGSLQEDAARALLSDWLGVGSRYLTENVLALALSLDDVLAANRSTRATLRLREWLWQQILDQPPMLHQIDPVVADVVQANGLVRPLPGTGSLMLR